MTELGSLAQRAALLACVLLSFQYAWAATRTSDVNALNEISQAWSGSISGLNWQGDPCDSKWTGVVCNNETVIQLSLDSRNLVGSIPSAIGNLTGLELLELSNNKDLGGTLPTEIGELENLEILSIQYSGLSGRLPSSLGKLRHLNFLGLNGNNLSGQIPAELGLTNITWLDLSVNRFSGEIPLIRNSIEGIGLDSIAPIVHYHLNNNSLNGSIPGELFAMPRVLHLLLDHNEFTGPLPSNITVSGRLQILRLDVNQLTGGIPSGLLNAANITDLNLKSNQFSGPLPNMSTLQKLAFLDMSDNDFDPSAVPSWITSLPFSTLNMANLSLFGEVPAELFDISSIEKLDLSGNDLNGTLTFSGTTSPSLMEVDLDHNDISGFAGQPSTGTNLSLSLVGNPLCTNSFVTPVNSCAHPLGTFQNPANSNCSESSSCEGGREYNFKACRCAYPLELHILLTSPAFYNLNQAATPLEKALADPGRLNLREDQAYISNMNYTWDARVNVFLWVFPETGDHLDGGVGDNITNRLRHHLFNLPSPWGPYLLPDNTYAASTGGDGLSTSSIVGIAVGSTVGFLVIALSVLLALYHKRRADKAMMSNPFASWGGGSAEFGEAPKLKGARWFSLAELKAYTNNWSDDNQIGVGGYGKVYRGTLPNGDFIAIKRATEGSLQGANEFKTEIELLSRVHHRNLLGLVGFSYEGGEQALIYEFMSEGTLYDHLKVGRDEGPLSWEWRLEIALASARGLAYLHDHASPPIIHRDVKSANILLNEKLVAKVADFGLSKLAPEEGEKAVYSVHVKGTLGYLDPEYYMTQNLTDKSDVYSFGVVLLEMLTARPPIVGNMYVVREFRTALDKGGARALRPLLDPAIADAPEKELDIYVAIAMNCVAEDGASRPFMAEVVKEFEALNGPEAGVRSMDVEGTGPGAKKVKFADNVLSESDKAKLLKNKSPEDTARRYQKANERAPGPFQYSGDFAGSTTVRPK